MHTGTAALIKRHIHNLPDGALFTTRDLLGYGLRNAIDQTMYRLVKFRWCIRVARGVFQKAQGSSKKLIGAFEVARAKAQSFGKRIIDHAAQTAKRLGISNEASQSCTYATDGRSSSFKFGDITIKLKGTAPRKMKLGQGRLADSLQALWHLGKGACDTPTIIAATRLWNRPERDGLITVTSLLPGWLRDRFCVRVPLQYWRSKVQKGSCRRTAGGSRRSKRW